MLATTPLNELTTIDYGYLNLLAGREAKNTLMRGFTTIRDLGGPTFGLSVRLTKASWSARASIRRAR